MSGADNIAAFTNTKQNSDRNVCQYCLRRALCLANSLDEEGVDELDLEIKHPSPIYRRHSAVRAGDRFDRLFIVHLGAFKSYRLYNDGVIQVSGFHLPGELMGLSGMQTGVHRDYIEALGTSSVCELPLATIEQLIAKRPALVNLLLSSISSEINNDKSMMYLLSRMNAEQKIASFLLDLSKRSYRSGFAKDCVHLSMMRGDIANYLGMAVETVSRVLKRLHDQGVLQIDYRTIYIMDRSALESLASEAGFSAVNMAS